MTAQNRWTVSYLLVWLAFTPESAFAENSLRYELFCPEIDEEGASELEVRVRLEAGFLGAATGALALRCSATSLAAEFAPGGSSGEGLGPFRLEKSRSAEAIPLRDQLLLLGVEVMSAHQATDPPEAAEPMGSKEPKEPSSPASEKPAATNAQEPARETSRPASSADGLAAEESSWFGKSSSSWAFDAALTYETLGSQSFGAVGLLVGGVHYLDGPVALRGRLGGALGVQAPNELGVGLVSLDVALEARARSWLVFYGGPLLSLMAFSVSSGSTPTPVSIEPGLSCGLGLSPNGFATGLQFEIGMRGYLEERLVRVDGVEAFRVPAVALSLTLGGRFAHPEKQKTLPHDPSWDYE